MVNPIRNESILKKIKSKKQKKLYAMVALFIVICIPLIIFCFQYYTNLYKTIQEESKGYLKEVAQRIGTNINNAIETNFAALQNMAGVLKNIEANSVADLEASLQEQQRHWKFEDLLLIDDAGMVQGIGSSQKTFFILDEISRKNILSKKSFLITAQIINNKEYSLFCVPFNKTTPDGKKIVALAGVYSPALFDRILLMGSFNNQAYSQIITKSGTVVTRPSSPIAMETGYNIFTSIQNADFDDNKSLARLKADIAVDNGGQITFTIDGVKRYMVYTPIQPDEWYLLTFVPVQAVNQKSDMLMRSTLLICALITVTFAGLVVSLIYSFNTHRNKLEHLAFVDEITGGNTIQRFYVLAQEILDRSKPGEYTLIYTNIEKFKVLNEQLGRQNCDILLSYFSEYIESRLTVDECMGRIFADNFCVLLRYEDEQSLLKRFQEWFAGAENHVQTGRMPWALPVMSFGIYVIDNNTLGLPQMIDRAKLALREFTHTFENKLHYAFYNDKIRRQLFREKQIEDMMAHALVDNQFRVYLQPKYRIPEEEVGGAEALVRWENPAEGMIFPNEFIPLFEKNGFIINLDLWVFEEVCRTLRSWEERGVQPIKISVNCSRIHFKNLSFLAPYIKIASEYNINRKYLEIEVTESVVLENIERLTAIITEIREAGFGCSMDDFGSGYSSLNLIQSIPVDTLKLDKIFFRGMKTETKKTEAVVGSIVSMAHALSMETVAEGVEEQEHVEMLKRVGCNYIQGYVFAKPMKIQAFEQLAFGISGEENA